MAGIQDGILRPGHHLKQDDPPRIRQDQRDGSMENLSMDATTQLPARPAPPADDTAPRERLDTEPPTPQQEPEVFSMSAAEYHRLLWVRSRPPCPRIRRAAT